MAKDNEVEFELYGFNVKTVKEVEEVSIHKDETTGEETKVIKTVKKETPTRIVIKRPGRSILDKAEIQYKIKVSEMVKLGVLTKAMVIKKYSDIGGIMTENDAKTLGKKYKNLADSQAEFAALSIKGDLLDEKNKANLQSVVESINKLRREISDLENSYNFIFENTADVVANNHVVLWYSLMLTYIQEEKDGKPVYIPFFAGNNFEEKLEDYYKKEDAADFLYVQTKYKLVWFISYWNVGNLQTKEDFALLDKEIDEGKV